MKTKAKTADDIISGFIGSKTKSYASEGHRELLAKSYHSILNEILTKTPKESDLLRHLISDYKNEIRGGSSFSPFPHWARKIAYCVINPDSKLSEERTRLIREYCATVCEEFLKDTEQETISFLANNDFDFLTQMARVFAR